MYKTKRTALCCPFFCTVTHRGGHFTPYIVVKKHFYTAYTQCYSAQIFSNSNLVTSNGTSRAPSPTSCSPRYVAEKSLRSLQILLYACNFLWIAMPIPHSSLITHHSSFLIPNSSFLTSHSSFLIPHSSLNTPPLDFSRNM